MKLLVELARAHPWLSLVMLASLLIASLAEAVGIASLLPLISLLAGSQGIGAEDASPAPELEAWLIEALAVLGLPATRETFLLVLPAAFFFRGAIVLMTRREMGYTIARFVKELRFRLIRALLGTSWSYYVEQRVGTFANAYSTEAMRASKAYLHATWVVSLVLQLAVYLLIALAISWQATLASVAAGLFVLLVLGPLVRVGRRAGIKQTRLFTSLLGSMTDIFQGVKPLKAMAREGCVAPMLEGGTRSMEKASRKQIFSREAIAALQEPIVVTILCAGLFVMIRMDFNVASMGVMVLLVQRSFDVLNRAQRRYQKVAMFESAYWSLMARIESAENAAEKLVGGPPPTLDRGIELRSIRLEYPRKTVFDDLSLEIPAGRITVLTGPSGGGKTSIVDLVVGLVEPNDGEVLIDGRPLAGIDLGSWREHVGYVPQEMFLLHDTIAMNVALGDPDVSREDIVHALKEAHAWDFVSRLSDGIDTVLGERGSLVSGGQRQRIAIARAMLHEPWLLVLDEATAALDPESEAAVWAVIEKLRGRTTVLAISHQAALIDAADRVFHVEAGVATEVRAGEVSSKSVSASHRST